MATCDASRLCDCRIRYSSPLVVCFPAFPSTGQRRVANTSLALVLVNHYFWFRHFSAAQQRSYSRISNIYDQPDVPSFVEIASYFGICVWLIPFALFVSLSASDNVLPTIGTEQPSHDVSGMNKRQSIVKLGVDHVLSGIGNVSRMAGWKKPEDRF